MKKLSLTLTLALTVFAVFAHAGPGDVGSVDATQISCQVFDHQTGETAEKKIALISSQTPKDYLVVENGDGKIYVTAFYTTNEGWENNEFAMKSQTAGVSVEGNSVSYQQAALQEASSLKMSIVANNKLLTVHCNYAK